MIDNLYAKTLDDTRKLVEANIFQELGAKFWLEILYPTTLKRICNDFSILMSQRFNAEVVIIKMQSQAPHIEYAVKYPDTPLGCPELTTTRCVYLN